jgi:SHS2 domain-containing protein
VRYEEIDHTADVGIRAYGASLEELFAAAAAGMFSLIADPLKVRPVGEVEVRVAGRDPEGLLVNWLQELLFVHETQRLLLCEFDVRIERLSLVGTARGEAIDKARHELRLAIKAVTYHRLSIDPEAGMAQVIFDI